MAQENIGTLLDSQTIASRVEALGAHISKDYEGKDLIIVPVLKGSFMFVADLARHITIPMEIDFLGLRSYSGTKSTGVVQITSDLSKPVEGKHILVVEDIVDTGLTMKYLLENLTTRGPASVRVASLLHKPARSTVKVPIDYLGFTIEDVFVVGYGLDYDGKYRNLPFVGILRNPGQQ